MGTKLAWADFSPVKLPVEGIFTVPRPVIFTVPRRLVLQYGGTIISNWLPKAVALGLVENLSKDVFERRTSTGSEAFFLFICLDAIKFSSLTFFSLLKTIYPRVLTKPLPNDAKSPVPVDVRRSKTLLLKFSTKPRATAFGSQLLMIVPPYWRTRRSSLGQKRQFQIFCFIFRLLTA